jgi:hypothetical protein
MTLTYKQALLAAFTILDDLYDQTKSESLGSLLGDMNPFIFADRTPADPAIWSEWVVCAETVQSGGFLTANNVFQTLSSFLRNHEQQYGYAKNTILESIQISSYQKRWNQLLEKASQNGAL